MQSIVKSFLVVSISMNLLAIGSIAYFFYFDTHDNTNQIASFQAKNQMVQNALKNLKISHSLSQDQHKLNMNEMYLIVEIMNLSKQFNLLTLKEHEESKMIRLIEETRQWMSKKSIFMTYIKGMNEQLDILLVVLKTKPSYETIKDIQNTITDIVAMMLQRSFVQTERFYTLTEQVKESLNGIESKLEEPPH